MHTVSLIAEYTSLKNAPWVILKLLLFFFPIQKTERIKAIDIGILTDSLHPPTPMHT